MDRRTLIRALAGSVAVAAAGCTSKRSTTEPKANAQAAKADDQAVRTRLVEWYRAFANPRVDREYYRAFMTDDYLLCENGKLLDKAGDERLLDTLEPDHVRTDRFDFRRVSIAGDRADLVYFLAAEMNDGKNGPRSRRWLESALMTKKDGTWRCSLLHSTRIQPPS